MSLFIEEEGNIKLDFDTEEIAALVIDAALELADCPYEAEINLLLTENAQIHEMNLEQRGIDRPTDVLSFPMIEYEKPGDFSVIDEESAEAFNPESGELMLGDIVISKEKSPHRISYGKSIPLENWKPIRSSRCLCRSRTAQHGVGISRGIWTLIQLSTTEASCIWT